MAKMHLKLRVNNREVEALAEPRMLLIHLLREQLGITGPHIGCDTSHCGACTVDMNGKSVKSCTVFAVQAQRRRYHHRRGPRRRPMAACIRCRRRFANITGCNAASAPRA